jgi:hypothetical protein
MELIILIFGLLALREWFSRQRRKALYRRDVLRRLEGLNHD